MNEATNNSNNLLFSPNAEIISHSQARAVNVSAAVGLCNVMKTNLGPHGTLKLLVGGAGQLKWTKDGMVLLKEMQIQHPTACLIARTATAQDDICGDGTTTTVLLCGELLRQAFLLQQEQGIHPRILVDGLEVARDHVLAFLQDEFAVYNNVTDDKSASALFPRELLSQVAGTSLRTKLDAELADTMTEAVVSALQCIAGNTLSLEQVPIVSKKQQLLQQTTSTNEEEKEPEESKEEEEEEAATTTKDSNTTQEEEDEEQKPKEEQDTTDEQPPTRSVYKLQRPLDLTRIEVMTMIQKQTTDSRFVNGLVLDHGGRHPNMPKNLQNCHVLTANVSLEYENPEVQSSFVYSTAQEREALVEAERKWLDEKCQKIIQLKRNVCKENESFVIINQKGVDPLSLDLFAKEGILCLRRAKRRNMERLTLACGGTPVLSLEDLSPDVLGYAKHVSEVTLGEDKYTFVEECGKEEEQDETTPKSPKACTILIQGPNKQSLMQLQDAVQDGLRAMKNVLEDGGAVVPGAGAFEVAASLYLQEEVIPNLLLSGNNTSKTKWGVQAFAQALWMIPKTLAENAGLDVHDVLLSLQEERHTTGLAIGMDGKTGDPMLPADHGIWDNVRVKRQSIYLATVLACQLLLVDEVMRAGKQMGKNAAAAAANPEDGMM